jgi:aspartate carbamoyltransferase catalytic subunit
VTRNLVSIEDLSNAQIGSLLDHAAEFDRRGKASTDVLEGAILATLFLEPSTRTRLSFEAAMHRLGGSVITSADPQASSSAKGESLADTVRMVDAYADAIVLRHPAAGAARAAGRIARAAILNAGDGGHEHPSQTLVDLFTLRRELGRLEGILVVLYGDLKYGRTTHSLVRALARFGGRVLALSEPGLQLPDYVVKILENQGVLAQPVELEGLESLFPGAPPSGLLIQRGEGRESWRPGRLALEASEVDAVYVTRLQKERLPSSAADSIVLPPVDARFLAAPPFHRAIVLHPLPRTREVDPGLDSDRRAAYFRQAASGVPVRMALLAWALGKLELDGAGPTRPPVVATNGRACADPACISVREPATTPSEAVRTADGVMRCAYCETVWPG